MTMPPSATPLVQEEDSESTIVVKMDLPIAQEMRRKRSGSDMSPEPAPTLPQATSTTPAKKRVKLTDAEKLAKEQEKLKKEQERKEKELEKERERIKKEEEKEQKRVAKEERQRSKDEAKRKKEDEQRKKEEEKRKRGEEKARKERSQLRLNSFFKIPTAAKESTPPTQPSGISPAPSPNPKPTQSISDYEKTFHPFFVKQNVIVTPPPFQKDDAYKAAISQVLDTALAQSDPIDTTEEAKVRGVTGKEIAELLHIPPQKIRRGNPLAYSTKDILTRINAPELPPLTKAGKGPYDAPFYLKLLNKLPNKFLKFAEDVRPPYNGTYSRKPSSSGLRKGRKPFERTIPGINYDYDSEAEWVADEEGEDLLSEDEDDRDSAGEEDDLDGFLDDEEDSGPKRGGVGVLVPLNSGMCWEDGQDQNNRPDLEEMRIGFLIEGLNGPIDPFSTSYWQPKSASRQTQSSAMDPPRLPLALTSQNLAVPSTSEAGNLPPRKLVPLEDVDAFRQAISGSDMTKAGLIEVLKKRFPKVTKEAIKNSLELHAERVGDRLDDKRWILK